MKYDDYKWHTANDFPNDLPKEAALIHMGIFMGWILDKGFEGELLKEHFNEQIKQFRNREITGSKFLQLCCDYKLVSEDLNDRANSFAKSYYSTGTYFDDYVDHTDDKNETIFHESDSWENYYKMKEVIEQRFQEWFLK
ncbi:MAG: DUF7832 domain-containing protein [Aequorivita sp.]